MNKKALYWICNIGGWLFFVLLNSLLLNLQNEFSATVVKNLAILLVVGIVVSHIYRNVIVRSGWLRLRTVQLIPRVIAAVIVFAALMESCQFLLEGLFRLSDFRHSLNNVLVDSLQMAVLLFFWSLIYFLFHYVENYRKAEIENLKWEASINEIELNKLKSQLNPHFMFNAMNSIRALVDENPAKSKEAITQLSNILRNTLQMGRNKVIAFDEEMRIVSDYLGLEAIRYEERLKTQLQIHEASAQFYLPPLMIQTLVENGIKHGISKLTSGGILSIITDVKDDKLIIQIRNSGQVNEQKGSDSGFGIKNTMQRLQLLYGKDASLHMRNENAQLVLTELIIPKRKDLAE